MLESGMERLWGVAVLLVSLLVARVFWVLKNTGRPLLRSSLKQRPLRTLIVLGSGGHTAELMSLVRELNLQRYAPRYYIAAVTDNMSLLRAERVEAELLNEQEIQAADETYKKPQFAQIYRSREVGQSYMTSVFTTLWAFVHALIRVLCIQPDVILCNGPGTCLPICIAGFLLKVVGLRWVVMVYVESIARVKKLSLTGLILYKLGLSDQFFVQWPKLKSIYPHTIYVGRLM